MCGHEAKAHGVFAIALKEQRENPGDDLRLTRIDFQLYLQCRH
jgi:hypothetical protein